MNTELVMTLVKFAVITVGLLLIVFIIALLTPKIANKIDKSKNNPARVSSDKKAKKGAYDFDDDELKSIYQINEKNDEKEDD